MHTIPRSLHFTSSQMTTEITSLSPKLTMLTLSVHCEQQLALKMRARYLINDWNVILLHSPCIIFHEYMCGFLLFTEFWCFAMRFSSYYKIWLSHRLMIGAQFHVLFSTNMQIFPVCRILVFCYDIKLL